MKHYIMIDIETKSTKNRAIIAAFCALYFTDKDDTHSSLLVCLDCHEQKLMGRVTDGPTLKFWDDQPKWLQELVLKGSEPAYNAIRQLSDMVSNIRSSMSLEDEIVFIGNPPSFDQSKLEDLMDNIGLVEYPWEHYEWVCLRTLRKQFNIQKDDIEFTGTPHHPYDDCLHQMKLFKLTQSVSQPAD